VPPRAKRSPSTWRAALSSNRHAARALAASGALLWRSYPDTAAMNDVTNAARRLLTAALALSEDERLELASEIIASVDGPPDSDWEQAWPRALGRIASSRTPCSAR